jgi:hypothetical protein
LAAEDVDNLGQTASGTVAVTVDPGPTLTNKAPSLIAAGKATAVGAATPGLGGDTLTLVTNGTGDAAPSHGTLSINRGQIFYTSSGTIPAGGETDLFTYQVKDQYGDLSAPVTASVTLDAGPTAKAGAITLFLETLTRRRFPIQCTNRDRQFGAVISSRLPPGKIPVAERK